VRLCWHVSGNGSGRLHRGAVSLPQSIDFYILAGMPAETVVVVCVMKLSRFLDPKTSTLRDMLRLCWHVSRNCSGRLHRETVSLPQSIDFYILAGMPTETVVVVRVCVMKPSRFLDPKTSTLRDMLRLSRCWHVSGNGSGRLHRGAVSLPRSIDFHILAGMPAETVVVVCVMEPSHFLNP